MESSAAFGSSFTGAGGDAPMSFSRRRRRHKKRPAAAANHLQEVFKNTIWW